MNEHSLEQKLERALTHSLNTHGFSFQHAVLKEAQIYFNKKNSPWAFDVSEFPVALNDTPTHIDFILKNTFEPFYIVAECKRANPSLSNWCFVKAPYVSRKISTGERVVREAISIIGDDNNRYPRTSLDWITRSQDIYRIAFEIKSDDKGDGKHGRGQINDAITQVLRGMNGLIEYLVRYNQLPLRSSKGFKRVSFMPVIFTTAKLWVSDVDMSTANLESGNLDISSIKVEQKDWIFYHYPQSPNIKHSVGSLNTGIELSEVLYWDYTRTIPIVNALGIRSFLSDNLWKDPHDWNR